jgi:hypothetical protein
MFSKLIKYGAESPPSRHFQLILNYECPRMSSKWAKHTVWGDKEKRHRGGKIILVFDIF